MHKQRLVEPAGQEDGRHLMTIHETSFPDILNVAALRAKCSFIASAHADHRDLMRQALLAAFKQANLDGREKAHELLLAGRQRAEMRRADFLAAGPADHRPA